MEKTNKDTVEPSFPEPFEHFDQELAPDIAHLRNAMNQLEHNQKEWQQALKEIKNVSFFHPSHKNQEATVLYYQENVRNLEAQVQEYQGKTYGRMERMLKEHEVEPELATQVMTALDAKVHHEKQENKSPDEDKNIIQEDKETESVNPAIGQPADLTHVTQADKIPSKQDYTISLIQQKREQQKQLQQQKTEISEKTNELGKSDGKESIPTSGSLNYQLNYELKYQSPVSKEQPNEKLVKDFSKNNKDISPDKD